MKPTNKQIKQAVDVLKSGGVVVFPTETCYGLAADATNAQAVRRLITIKGRGRKTLPLIASSLVMVEAYTKMSELARRVARKYWPGPVTLVLPARQEQIQSPFRGVRSRTGLKAVGNRLVPQCVRDDMVAIRISSHPVARALSKGLGQPIVATSANRSGEPECYLVNSLKRQYAKQKLQPDYILDAGTLPKSAPSTIVKVDRDRLRVLREGSVKFPQHDNFS
ncbi:MAG: L-threonylcarbamoyladenylate synthase [Candidatus Uhrbacteria bacterium]|nr:threonylcarbamoyl-AMP synthase [Patescibacteria group bacterium]MBU1906523.1 threonylcarbamoyl-AMP synthase [Patescibacteria group bacterium]